MIHPCLQTTILLACVCSAFGKTLMMAYEKKLELLTSVIKYDYLWRPILLERVFYPLDRTHYQHIIENELLDNALDLTPDTQKPAVDEGETSVPVERMMRDGIIPYMFIRNILFKGRFVIGSILDMGLTVLKLSCQCLMYKHLAHLIFLIFKEVQRKVEQKKAASWAVKSKHFVEKFIMIMGSLQFTDKFVLNTLKLLNTYKNNSNVETRNNYLKGLGDSRSAMMKYVNDNCIQRPTIGATSTEEQLATIIGQELPKELFSALAAEYIADDKYKTFLKRSQQRILDVFGTKPRLNGMSVTTWNEIFCSTKKQSENVVQL
ncbi:hypothetical protein AGLY_007280 [Aphis glycines]|uniref:Uncharacterized protein n=1 Tax=Aphis glycines TaxID=307491 RepID=A0A6G0TPP3_APHGL|nr:hypothetical protein AGLY_007280 [Aphis glycines]